MNRQDRPVGGLPAGFDVMAMGRRVHEVCAGMTDGETDMCAVMAYPGGKAFGYVRRIGSHWLSAVGSPEEERDVYVYFHTFAAAAAYAAQAVQETALGGGQR